jgi:hypothetical protein
MAVTTDEDVVASNGSLADAAASASNDVPEFDQRGPAEALDVPEGTIYNFVGVKFHQNAEPASLGEQVKFVVEGVVVGKSTELMADGHERDSLKIKVEHVNPA